MRRIADLYPGEAKTDAKDAAVIADAARTMPHTLRSLQLTDEITAELTVLTGCSPSSTRRWSACSGRGWTTRPSPGSSSATGPRPRCRKPAGADSSNSSARNPADGRVAGRRGL
ncbi:hypothetical protein GCM10018773_62290 [Streptomyces candidus]|nr:hypothetical protein GCM10018773_62290 [Streptomyces candidus]